MKKIIPVLLMLCILMSMSTALAIEEGEARAVIGADLTEEQIASVYAAFGLNRGDVPELRVTNSEEREYLSGFVSDSVIGTRSISCVYIEILPEGSGLDVTTSNISWCTDDMYLNSLVTAGIVDAKVVITAPLTVSGTAALTGIFKAYEDITGEKLDDVAKLVGTQELVVTAELAGTIGSYDAVAIVNELKLLLSETKDMSDEELRAEVSTLATEYNISLTDKQIDQLLSLCRSMEGLDDEALKARVEDVQKALKTVVDAKEKMSKFSETMSRISESVKNAVSAIVDFFRNLFGKGEA